MFRLRAPAGLKGKALLLALVGTLLAVASQASAAPLLQSFNIGTGGPDSLTGKIGGALSAQATGGSIVANFTDVDIDTNILDFTNRTGQVTLNVNTSTSKVNLNLPNTSFSSGLTGSLSGTADDSATDAAPGSLGWLVPGTDGRWDDPNNTGSFVNAQFSGASLATTSNIGISASTSGGIFGTGTGNINLGTVLFQTLRLNVLNTSTFSATFDPVQTVSVQNLALSTSVPFATNLPVSNFVEASHPVGSPVADLSVNGGGLISTTVSGNLVATLTGSISATLNLSVTWGSLTLTTLNNAFNGPLFSGDLFTINESINLTETLPFVFSILHEPTTNVDYDDVVAMLQTGTLGAQFPLSINETTNVAVPATPIAIQNLSTPSGTVRINDLDIVGNLTGNISATLSGTANLGADLLAQAILTSAANIQPQNTGPTSIAASSTNNPNYSNTFAGTFDDADLAANQFIPSYETLMFEFDTSPATLASQVGDGFMTGMTTPSQFTSGLLGGTLSLTQLLSIFGNLGTYTAYANVADADGQVHSIPFTVNVVPEPSSLLVWSGLIGAAAIWQRRLRIVRSRAA